MNAPQIKVLRSFIKWAKASFKAGDTLPEAERAEIHALTRKVTLTDEDILAMFRYGGEFWGYYDGQEAIDPMKDLRDRYEERGKYAAPSPDQSKYACLGCGTVFDEPTIHICPPLPDGDTPDPPQPA